MVGIFTERMNPTFDTKGDAMPAGDLWGTRRKYIHSVGTVGKVKFVSDGNHDYTGIFKGADYGYLRASSGQKPSKDAPLAPGFGLKFLRDGVDSANLVAMYGEHLGQKDDWNFFSNDFTTHISGPEGTAQKALSAKFSAATDFIQQVGLSDFAKWDQ